MSDIGIRVLIDIGADTIELTEKEARVLYKALESLFNNSWGGGVTRTTYQGSSSGPDDISFRTN